eukprot:m.33086 g.33086  ORF g.33086 m.33086 type:complete len:256 (+) comp16754_c0_seq2:177-944(+)
MNSQTEFDTSVNAIICECVTALKLDEQLCGMLPSGVVAITFDEELLEKIDLDSPQLRDDAQIELRLFVIKVRRFINVKNLDVKDTLKLVREWLIWENSAKPICDIEPELRTGKIVYAGRGGTGIPIFVLKFKLHFAPAKDAGFTRESSTNLMFAIFGLAEHLSPETGGSFELVIDLHSFGFGNIDRGILKHLGNIVSKTHSEVSHRSTSDDCQRIMAVAQTFGATAMDGDFSLSQRGHQSGLDHRHLAISNGFWR